MAPLECLLARRLSGVIALAIAGFATGVSSGATPSRALQVFLKSGDPVILSGLAETVPVETISSELASVARPDGQRGVSRSVVARGTATREFFQPLAISSESGGHILYTRMSLISERDSLGKKNSWRTELLDSAALTSSSPESRRSLPVFDALAEIRTVRLLQDRSKALVAVFAVSNHASTVQAGIPPNRANIFLSRFDGQWSPPEALLSESFPFLSAGIDARFDSKGRLHVVYAHWNGNHETVRHLTVDRSRRRHDRVLGDIADFHLQNPSILQVDSRLIALASGNTSDGLRFRNYLLSHDGPPIEFGHHATSVRSTFESGRVTTLAAVLHTTPVIAWWTLTDGSPSERNLVPAVPIDTLQIVRGAPSPLFLVTRGRSVYLLRHRHGVTEAATLYNAAVVDGVHSRARSRLNNRELEVVVSDQALSAQAQMERIVFSLDALRWAPIRREVWRNTAGRGLSWEERREIHALMTARMKATRGERRILIADAIARNFDDKRAVAELERRCSSATSPACAAYIERRDAWDCRVRPNGAGGSRPIYVEKCRQREDRRLSEGCPAETRPSASCMRWRYGTGRATDPFLAAAFEQDHTPPTASDQQLAAARRELSDFRTKAEREERGQLSAWFAKEGFPLVTTFLRHRDPIVRSAVAAELARLDLLRATPFLVGLVTDCDWRESRYQRWHGSPGIISVCETAKRLLRGYPYMQSVPRRLPLDDLDPLTADRVFQRFVLANYRAHHQSDDRGGAFGYVRAIALKRGITGGEAKRLALAGATGDLVRVELEPETRDTLRFATGTPVRASLTVRNLGSRVVSVRGFRDQEVHQLRLTGPDGRERPLRTAGLTQSFFSASLIHLSGNVLKATIYNRFAAGQVSWTFDLAKLFDLSQPGRYVLRYHYVPPSRPEAYELTATQQFDFWNGREYDHELEFEVTP